MIENEIKLEMSQPEFLKMQSDGSQWMSSLHQIAWKESLISKMKEVKLVGVINDD
jgi:hypothetical protein